MANKTQNKEIIHLINKRNAQEATNIYFHIMKNPIVINNKENYLAFIQEKQLSYAALQILQVLRNFIGGAILAAFYLLLWHP